jgi:hypothetical protein
MTREWWDALTPEQKTAVTDFVIDCLLGFLRVANNTEQPPDSLALSEWIGSWDPKNPAR